MPKPENVFYAFHTSLGASSPNKSGSGAKKALLKETQQLMNDLFKQQMPALAHRAVSFPVLSKVASINIPSTQLCIMFPSSPARSVASWGLNIRPGISVSLTDPGFGSAGQPTSVDFHLPARIMLL